MRTRICSLLVCLLVLSLVGSPSSADEPPATRAAREVVAEVVGQPVYRDELPPPAEQLQKISEYSSAVSGRVLGPLMEAYRREHQAELTPADAELRQMADYLDREHQKTLPERRARLAEVEQKLADPSLDAPAREQLQRQKEAVQSMLEPHGQMVAQMLLPGWKLQRHLYDRFGGGRVLWQQFGAEAFDATRRWLEAEERAGRLKFHDPQVRRAVFVYWTTHPHGAFLTDDPERIDEFLNPRWKRVPAASQPAPDVP